MTRVADAVFRDNRHGDRPALLDGASHALSYAQLQSAAETLASALAAAGLTADDRIASVLPRGPVGLVAFLAASSVGCCCPLNPGMREDEFKAYLGMLGVTALIDGTASAAVAEVAALLYLPLISVAWNEGDILIHSSAERSRPRRKEDVRDPLPSGTALLMQTSGTTAKPKLVPLTHANILSAASGIASWFALGTEDVCLNPMPLHHLHGLITAGLASLLAGSTVYCTDGFSPAGFHELLAEVQPTWFTGSPTMHLALRAFYTRGSEGVPCTRLRFFRSSSAPLAASVIRELEAIFEAPLMETYGLTETSSMICANPLPPGIRKVGSVGVATGAEIRVVDADGAAVPAQEPGEVVVRGPSVIRGYLGDGQPGSAAFFGDWLRTGDIGYLDADGYLFIVGRTKELIKRGGLSVYPDEVDNALVSHPAVAEAVTFALPHPTLGEELVSAIVAKAGQVPTEDALRDFLGTRLSTYKVPAAIVCLSALPKSETGKILRREVPAQCTDAFRLRNEPPGNEIESTLLELWRDVLGRSDFGVGDNLLLLGADPIQAGAVAEAMIAKTGSHIAVKQMLRRPTIRAMATTLGRRESVA